MYQVVKRDEKIVDFNISKISEAIKKAFEAVKVEYNDDVIDLLALKVTADYAGKIKDNKIRNVGSIHGFCHLVVFGCYYLIIVGFKESRYEIQYISFILYEKDLIFVFVHPKHPPSLVKI